MINAKVFRLSAFYKHSSLSIVKVLLIGLVMVFSGRLLASEQTTTAGQLSTEKSAPEWSALHSEPLPNGLSFVALVDDQWHVMVVKAGLLTRIPDILHARSVAYHDASNRVAWVGADNKLYERELSGGVTQQLGDTEENVRYTQPTYAPDGKSLIVVELPNGRSRSTNIVAFELLTGQKDYLVRKRTAQFEPHLSNDRLLHYTTAICVDDCIGMIWELWQRDLHSGRQIQLSLLNAVSKAPRLGNDKWLYFSSDAAGTGFHLWRMKPEPNATPEQLTQGFVRDSDPSPGNDGAVYFIRRSPQGTKLMKIKPGSEAVAIVLDERVKDMRDLELRP